MSKEMRRYPPSTIRYPLLIAFAITAAACSPKGEALYNRASEALARGDNRAAVIDLRNLADSEPQNARARALLGQALVQSGDLQGGAIEIQKAKDLGAKADVLMVPECQLLSAKGESDKVLAQCDPEKAPASAKAAMQIARGQALIALARPADAKAQFEAALAARPDSVEALIGLAASAYQTGGLAAAKSVIDKAPESVRKQTRYWMASGGINLEGNDFPAAEKDYQKALDLAGKGPESVERLAALGALAEVQMRQGKIKEAEATTALLIKAAPDNPIVKQMRGQVAAAGGKLDEARTLLEEAVAEMPENHQARTLLGIVNLQQGNLGQAEMHFSSVVANNPNDVRAQRLLAETRMKSQTPQETLASMQSALQQSTADPSLLAMAGRLSLASGDREQGLAYLAKASAQTAATGASATSPDVQLEVASSYLMAGDLDRAVELLQSMPQGGATDYQREYLLMRALLLKGEKDKAVTEAKALVERSGSDPAVRNLAGGVLAAAGQPAAAREQFNEALKLKRHDPDSLLNLGRLDLAEGKTVDAVANFSELLEADPTNLLGTLGMAVAVSAQGKQKEAEKYLQKAVTDHPESADAQLALAQFYLGTRDFGKARAVIDAAGKKWPDNAAISNARGFAQMGANDLPGAMASFKQATQQDPKTYVYSLNLARTHLANRDIDAALDVLNGVLKADPKFIPALALAAAAALQAGQVEKAAGYVERMRQAAPDTQATLALEGDLAMSQKRYREALELYRKAGAKGQSREIVLAQYRAGALARTPQPEKVLEDWVAANPKDLDAAAVLAEAYQTRGDNERAIALYEQILAQVPANPLTLNNLAVLYGAKGDPKALETAEKAYNAAPKAPAIQDTYGWALFQAGNNDKALSLLGEAIKGMPDNAEVQYHYAAALARKGDKAEAVALLKKAVNGQLPANLKADAQQLLQQLTK